MFGRILELQHKEYGPHDRRCYVTIDKINMVRSRGTNFEHAIEELRKTFSMPVVEKKSTPAEAQSDQTDQAKAQQSLKSQSMPVPKGKGQKNKVMKVLSSMRKKKTQQ